MAEETPAPTPTTEKQKRPGRRLGKIPKEILFSPGGVFLIFFALIIEIIDWIPLAGLDSLTWELAIEIIFIIFLAIIAKVSFKSMITPFIIERIPVVSDIIPTWLIRLFI